MTDIKRFYKVGGGSSKYTENYNKIKWNDKVEIKEFVEKEDIDPTLSSCYFCGAALEVVWDPNKRYVNLDKEQIKGLKKELQDMFNEYMNIESELKSEIAVKQQLIDALKNKME